MLENTRQHDREYEKGSRRVCQLKSSYSTTLVLDWLFVAGQKTEFIALGYSLRETMHNPLKTAII